MTAASGQTPWQLSHSKQLPHYRHRRPSNSALLSSRLPCTSSKLDCRRISSSVIRGILGASAQYVPQRIDTPSST